MREGNLYTTTAATGPSRAQERQSYPRIRRARVEGRHKRAVEMNWTQHRALAQDKTCASNQPPNTDHRKASSPVVHDCRSHSHTKQKSQEEAWHCTPLRMTKTEAKDTAP